MKLRAKYKVTGPHKVKVTITKASMDDTGSMVTKEEVVEDNRYMVYFPQGHSIRIDRDELVRLGYNKKPRIVDMETGDVLQHGGDPYDFENIEDVEVHLDNDMGDDRDIVEAIQSSKKG